MSLFMAYLTCVYNCVQPGHYQERVHRSDIEHLLHASCDSQMSCGFARSGLHFVFLERYPPGYPFLCAVNCLRLYLTPQHTFAGFLLSVGDFLLIFHCTHVGLCILPQQELSLFTCLFISIIVDSDSCLFHLH